MVAVSDKQSLVSKLTLFETIIVMYLTLIKLTLIILILTFCILADVETALGQSEENRPRIIEKESGDYILSQMDILLNEAYQRKERVYVVSRLGTGEKNIRLNLARLAKAKEYFRVRKVLDMQDKFSPPIFAEGENIKGKGRMEFYIGSQLFLVVLAERNKGMSFMCDECP
jgi:hypothetical protein